MIRLWRQLIKPVLDAAGAKSILEIGAEFGSSTKVFLNYTKEKNGHFYCIDPVPEFDVEEFQANNAEALTFYRDFSLNVLPGHVPFDVAVVDGDHNWYTVYNELKLIEEIHQHDPLRQPLVFIHDVGWPYGRRDLYYDPATVPEQYRQPHEKKGILPNKSELVADRGLNTVLWNASHEGGERNGVLTAVEDYLKETALEYEFINIPAYFGLGVLVTKQRLAENSKLQSVVEDLKTYKNAQDLVQLVEHLRCVEAVFSQSLSRKLSAAKSHIAKLEAQLEGAGLAPSQRDGGAA